MTKPSLCRAALCQTPPARVIAVLITLAGCGGAVTSPVEGSGPPTTRSGCPTKSEIDTGSAIGEACSPEGAYCPSPGCDPCEATCAALACTNGAWKKAVNTAICTDAPDAGKVAVDAGACIDVDPSTFDRSCTIDADCFQVTAGTFCSGQAWCMCGIAAINVSDKSRYDAEMNAVQSLKAGSGGCFCPYLGKPTCVAGTCTLCGGPNSCADGG